MAIKPKSRAHEDRIKALEIADGIDRELAHEVDERIEHIEQDVRMLHSKVSFWLSLQDLTQKPPRRWWQFWK